MWQRNKEGCMMLEWRIKHSSAPFPPVNQLCSAMGAFPFMGFRPSLGSWALFLSTHMWRRRIFPFIPQECHGYSLGMSLARGWIQAEGEEEEGIAGFALSISEFSASSKGGGWPRTPPPALAKAVWAHQEFGTDGQWQVCRSHSFQQDVAFGSDSGLFVRDLSQPFKSPGFTNPPLIVSCFEQFT